ncbi:MAG: hypothetical protein KGY65_04725 [Candidatus Thermoplasmatota archaeon]|nr:hypothetical protein [Candidatus Thermoplasmatota archaeon]MBS3802035.1 hypothetical protein [Candidatus Thermoplasmatota archaeon]
MDDNEIQINSYEMDTTQKKKGKDDAKPLIAGILLFITGIMGILTWIVALSFDISMIDLSMIETQNVTITPSQLQSIIQTCAIIGIILSVFPLLGGILSIQKKLWGGALSCSIIGLFTIGPIFLSSIFSAISLILLIMSKDQFYQKEATIKNEY